MLTRIFPPGPALAGPDMSKFHQNIFCFCKCISAENAVFDLQTTFFDGFSVFFRFLVEICLRTPIKPPQKASSRPKTYKFRFLRKVGRPRQDWTTQVLKEGFTRFGYETLHNLLLDRSPGALKRWILRVRSSFELRPVGQ